MVSLKDHDLGAALLQQPGERQPIRSAANDGDFLSVNGT